jgi:DNA-binding PadR family transcriptional regulator
MKPDSQFGFALLGLIHQRAMSGYDLRKIFTTTAMGSYSDSPGAIYPALARLEASGLVRGTVEESTSLRVRRVYQITPKGLAAFKAWLKKPVTQDDIIRRVGELMLRFAFMDGAVGAGWAIRFLQEFANEIESYLQGLKHYLETQASKMPLSGRLALECGIQEYELKVRWARSAAVQYEQRKRKQA